MSSVIKFICYICGNICNKLSRVISETENVMIGKADKDHTVKTL